MAVSEHWRYQGRQYHQWFGHGTAPREENEAGPSKPGGLFDPLSVAKRIKSATGVVVAHAPRDQWSRWETRIAGSTLDSLKTCIAVWYGASKLSRDTFRQRLFDPNTSDETVDRLRNAAQGIVDARNHAQLGAAGDSLAAAAQTIGLDRWPRFIGDAERGGIAAVSEGTIPGVVEASAPGVDMGVGVIALGLALLTLGVQNRGPRAARPTISPTMPSDVPVDKPEDDTGGTTPKADPTVGLAPDLTPGPGGVVVSDDRRKHILDGDGKGNGGHGAGRQYTGQISIS